MRHPPYHLRPNKAVDRLMFVEAIRRLGKLAPLSDYTYYGLGGPYLEDFRLLYDFCPEIKMVSIERDKETFKRQKFHLPCGTLRLEKTDFKSFLARYESRDERSIFWLDYTGLEYGHFGEFMALLGKISENSMIKVTLRAEPRDYFDESGAERFKREFGALTDADPPREFRDFACLLQDMLQVAAEKALPSAMPLMFHPVSSFYYADGAKMFTLTGLICVRTEAAMVKNAFRDWQFANLHWGKPKRIDVPVLSTKERLHLQNLLPCRGRAGRMLRAALGYLIDDDRRKTDIKLKQYAEFHRYFPYFMKGIP